MMKERYPSDWPAIAAGVRAAAGYVCQDCGMQCRLPGERFDTHRRTMSVHHINHTPADCAPANLIPLCSGCHLRRDAPYHAQNAARTRRRKVIDAGQVELELL